MFLSTKSLFVNRPGTFFNSVFLLSLVNLIMRRSTASKRVFIIKHICTVRNGEIAG